MLVIIQNVCGHVRQLVILYDLLIIFVRGKTDHHC